jgi:uncharacterized membrane protein
MAGGARIAGIDAARGAAMLLVLVSHVKQHFAVAPDLHFVLVAATRIATPTFLLLSGLVAAHLLRNDTRGTVALTLADRALFLLVVAHALLGLEDLPEYGVAHWLFGRVAMTDAIAVAFLAAILLRNASVATLVRVGVCLCLGSWLIATTIAFPWEWARAAARVLFASRLALDGSMAGQSLPLIPYVGVFLLGMALSVHLRSVMGAGDSRRLSRELALFGAAAVGLAVAGVLLWMATSHVLPDAIRETDAARLVRSTLDPRIKQPPTPAYFLFYGGAGLLMLAMFVRGWPPRFIVPIRRHAAVIGRASLFCFIVQDWLFRGVPQALGFDRTPSVAFWCVYLLASGILLYTLAAWWDANGNNRYITVGLKSLLRRRAGRRKTPIGVRTV